MLQERETPERTLALLRDTTFFANSLKLGVFEYNDLRRGLLSIGWMAEDRP